ncbi:oligosaccharide flippase family protein [Ureibacillus acetophenoni]|uniref:O-antigen/teichoic acid export membrane protein n=1 Tax=Ureibacillus acetophenoni TaxID=614649 RepID=A0A285U9G4_9BACL|nr:oligosaccharide flippase family protein [Ureibacillus acetophenoni]SOC38459.1 O-antigen/teichoic acid export membrane protein [Ureibacillus acetophenoni]
MKANSIQKNIIHLFYSTIFANLLNAGTLILLANYFNAKNYGIFSISLAISMIMHYFTDMGVSNTYLREGSKQAHVEDKFQSYLKIRLICLFFTLVIVGVGIQILYEEQQLISMIYSLTLPMVIGLTLQSIGITYFQLTKTMQFIAFIRIFSSIVLIVFIFFSMYFNLDVYFSATAYGLAYLCGGIFSLYLLSRKVSVRWKIPFQSELLKNLGPFFISGLFIMLIPQLGPLILGNTLSLSLVGLFAVAYRIPSAIYQIPGVIAGAFYPLLFQYYNQGEKEEHTRLHILQLKLMGFTGMCLSISLFYMAGYLVDMLFGEAWLDAIQPLQILSFIIVLQGFNIAAADNLTTSGLQGSRVFVQFMTALVGIFSIYYLSILYGVIGATAAILIIEMTSFIGFTLANPERKKVILQVIIPYGTNFLVSSISVYYFLQSYPFIAVIVTNIVVIVLILLFDWSVRDKIIEYIWKNKLMSRDINGGQRKNGKIAK